jgi:hypothetical protein
MVSVTEILPRCRGSAVRSTTSGFRRKNPRKYPSEGRPLKFGVLPSLAIDPAAVSKSDFLRGKPLFDSSMSQLAKRLSSSVFKTDGAPSIRDAISGDLPFIMLFKVDLGNPKRLAASLKDAPELTALQALSIASTLYIGRFLGAISDKKLLIDIG